jgi:hypothetical protein
MCVYGGRGVGGQEGRGGRRACTHTCSTAGARSPEPFDPGPVRATYASPRCRIGAAVSVSMPSGPGYVPAPGYKLCALLVPHEVGHRAATFLQLFRQLVPWPTTAAIAHVNLRLCSKRSSCVLRQSMSCLRHCLDSSRKLRAEAVSAPVSRTDIASDMAICSQIAQTALLSEMSSGVSDDQGKHAAHNIYGNA